ncbi:hypothetical protein J7438_07130 [Thalassotalea sp. G20_0]|uniref:hypothetical protein n=1 Tax=Thalassotalea sp. G20_0 TaxID=2821093 RepID=UPI001ADA3C97|nr:hypothetical protein [Thalassotalea sp. G20_0]MBO9493858.1 hypothetical protein [Thalassotalea sp. G20_0]
MGILASDLRINVIQPVLKSIGLYSLAAENLLLGTAVQESLCGKHLVQVQGPALGIYQIEPDTHDDAWQNYLNFRHELAGKVRGFASSDFDQSSENRHQELVLNLGYATAIARIVYYRKPEALPDDPNDIEALARYWKKHYNTPLGKGTTEEFVRNYKDFV